MSEIVKLINEKIDKDYCKEISDLLSDLSLMNEYKKSKSLIKKTSDLKKILEKNKIKKDVIKNIIDDYIIELIPAGTKGVIRGNKFNEIVKKTINGFNLDKERFKIQFEKKHDDVKTDEIPDWYIYDNVNKKVIIGMNQLDLIGGGQQMNRGYKYLIDNKINTPNSKLLCVICNHAKFTKESKKTKLFEVGFANNTLTYVNNLKKVIDEYFD